MLKSEPPGVPHLMPPFFMQRRKTVPGVPPGPCIKLTPFISCWTFRGFVRAGTLRPLLGYFNFCPGYFKKFVTIYFFGWKNKKRNDVLHSCPPCAAH